MRPRVNHRPYFLVKFKPKVGIGVVLRPFPRAVGGLRKPKAWTFYRRAGCLSGAHVMKKKLKRKGPRPEKTASSHRSISFEFI